MESLEDITSEDLMEEYKKAFLAFNPDIGPVDVTIDEESNLYQIVYGIEGHERTITGLYSEDLYKMTVDLIREVREIKDTKEWLISKEEVLS